jgi:hypothetical protein
MRKIMKIIRLTAFLLITALVASCGGGGSSSGGSSFSGNGTFRLFTPGVPAVLGELNLTVRVDGSTVFISTSFGTNGSAPLSSDGNSYIVPVPLDLQSGITTCSGEFVFSGTITGGTTAGSISGSLPCRTNSVQFRTTVSGSFSANN